MRSQRIQLSDSLSDIAGLTFIKPQATSHKRAGHAVSRSVNGQSGINDKILSRAAAGLFGTQKKRQTRAVRCIQPDF